MATDSDCVQVDLDNILERLLEGRENHPHNKFVQLSDVEIKFLCERSTEIFLRQPMLLELKAPIKICGNLFGQYADLLRHFEGNGFPPKSNYLFLGNYVDRNKQSLETICLLLAYKIKYPDDVYLLRGNHECASINRIYGFYDECKRRHNVKVWKLFTQCFNCLPVAATIDGKIFCCHGGLSPELDSIEQIRHIPRPTDVPDNGLLHDLLWSDPNPSITEWNDNDVGVSFEFGANVLIRFLKKNKLDLVCRSHQVVDNGYEFFADRRLVTIFSIPNHLGEWGNAGALLCVDEHLTCSFAILPSSRTQNDSKSLSYDPAQSGNRAAVTSPSTPTDTELQHVRWADLNET